MKKTGDITFINKSPGKACNVPGIAPVIGIYFVIRLNRPPGHNIITNTPPGHNFQYVSSGNLEFEVNGVTHKASKGDVLYFYESEIEKVTAGEKGFQIISVVLNAPQIMTPSKRVFKADAKIKSVFFEIYESYYRNSEDSPYKSYMLVYQLILLLIEKGHLGSEIINSKEIWQSIESYIRRKSAYQISISELCEIFKCSRSAIQKSCLKIAGMSPKKCIKTICLGEARGLLLHSELSVTDIAKRLGYKRLHEFTRDFSKIFNISPSQFRELLRSKQT